MRSEVAEATTVIIAQRVSTILHAEVDFLEQTLCPPMQISKGLITHITEAGVRLRPWVLHYASPDELDALAAEAGLRRVERHAGWRGQEFTAAAETHVTVYAAAR